MFSPWTKSQAGLVGCLEPYEECNIISEMHVCRTWLQRAADLLKHVAVDVIQPFQLLALCGHEPAPVMGRFAIQTPTASKQCASIHNKRPSHALGGVSTMMRTPQVVLHFLFLLFFLLPFDTND